jgi:hypothetical protein
MYIWGWDSENAQWDLKIEACHRKCMKKHDQNGLDDGLDAA